MDINLDEVVSEFRALDESLIDGEWGSIQDSTPTSFSVDLIRQKFGAYDELTDDEGRIKIPLHESDSAELTGDYLLYSPASLTPVYAYFDNEKGDRARIQPSQIDDTVFAWRVRFWSSSYSSSEPSYSSGEETQLQATAPPAVIEPKIEYTDSEETDFYDRLRDFVADQREADRAEGRDSYEHLPFPAYRGQEGGIPSVVPFSYRQSDSGQDPQITVLIPEAHRGKDIRGDYGIFEDNEVLVYVFEFGEGERNGKSEEGLPVEGIVRGMNGHRISIELFQSRCDSATLDRLETVINRNDTLLRIASLYNPVPYNREAEAIRTARNTAEKREVITGGDPLTFEPDETVGVEFPTLNQQQSTAAKRAVAANDLVCIHGPPGTGKTRTLVSLVQKLVESGQKVLACAHSNQATDNLLAGSSTDEEADSGSLHGVLDDDVAIARVGSHVSHPVVAANYWVRKTSANSTTADVVGATMSAAADFDVNEFDVAVIDEASQASIPATLIPFAAAQNVVLAGDHKQLPPYSSTELEEREMEISLFEHFIERYGDEVATLLQKQYRMNEAIASFPNEAFYDGSLETAARNRDWTLGDLEPVSGIAVDGDESRANGRSRKNEAEAEVAAQRVSELLDERVDPAEIGVITAYRGQIEPVKNELSKLEVGTSRVKVNTIDSFQGSEREAIIVSFVRSNEEGRAGFLTLPEEGPRRLNVGLTRARKQLTLLGNWETLRASEDKADCTDVYSDLAEWLIQQGFMQSIKATKA
jgi:Ni2+-binding GTPase involved in maturation of urease and hydrogenase